MSSSKHWLRRRLLSCLLLAAFALSWSAAQAVQPASVTNTITTKTNYYFAYGATAADLNQSLQAAAPWRWRTGSSVHAQTAWSVNYSYNYARVDGRIAPTRFDVKTKITVTLPFWHMPKDVSSELRQHWLGYLRALYTHEQGHLDFARQATTDLGQALAGLGDFATVQELRHALALASTNVLTRVRQQEAHYDAETKHGATQGAVLRIGPASPPAGSQPTPAPPPR